LSATLDSNILLYASDEASPYHARARAFLQTLAGGPDLVHLFWPTIMSYLRIATHPSIFDRPLSFREATDNVTDLLERAHIRTTGERHGFWNTYRDIGEDLAPTGNLVPDAHLVALMLENGVRSIWTRDRDFRKFRGIETRDPFE
jgi:toxin-antitoxin system PIN domain toxin